MRSFQRERADGTKPADPKPHGAQGLRVDYDGPAAKLRIDPAQNVIVGLENIKRYLGVRSNSTIWRWVEVFAFPAVKRPDGLWMSTMTAIDQWIFLGAEVANEALKKSRGLNVKAEIALERLQRQMANGTYSRERVRIAMKAAKATSLLPPEQSVQTRATLGREQPHARSACAVGTDADTANNDDEDDLNAYDGSMMR